jgi:hypothetical protein
LKLTITGQAPALTIRLSHASRRNNAFAVTMIAALFGKQHTVYVLPAERTLLL